MIAEFLGRQIDFYLFVSGLAFFVLFVVSLILNQEPKRRLPWMLMAVFALVQGIKELVMLVAMSFGNGVEFSIISLILTVISYVFLLEFGRVGLKIIAGKSVGRWIHIPLLVGAGLGGFAGITGLNAAIHYIYGLGGGLWVSFVLFRTARIQNSKALSFAALLMTGIAIADGVIVARAGFIPASLINTDSFFHWIGIPIELFAGPITLMLSFTIWKTYKEIKEPVLSADGSRPTNFFEMQFILVFLIFIFASRGLAEYAGNLASQTVYHNILDRITLAKYVIDVDEFKPLKADLLDVTQPGYVSLRQKLIDIKSSDAQLQDVYLMIKKADWIYFAVDSLPYKDSNFRVPRLLYRNPPPMLFDVFSSGNTRVIGPYSDEYGAFVSGYAPIIDVRSSAVIGVLGMDTNAGELQTLISKYRLITFAITLLAFFIFIGYFSVRERSWETAQRIAASERSLVQAQTIAQIGSWTWNVNSNHFFWSAEMYRIFGRPFENKIRTFLDLQAFFSPEEWLLFNTTVQKSIQEGKEFELESKIIYVDQSQRYVVTRGMPRVEKDGQVKLLLGISQDVTERKEADDNVRKLSQAIEQSPISVVITDLSGQIEYVNPKFSKLTGYSLAEAVGQNPRVLKSGETPAEEYADLWHMIQSGQQWAGEFHNIKKNGELYWESAVISPILDEYGKIAHFVAIKEDITERKRVRMELEKTHKELAKTNLELKNASKVKSQFLANMSHEIRTPLNAIIGMTGLLLDTPLNLEQENYAGTVRNSGEVLLSLINDILDFSKIEAQKMELENQSFELRSCIEEALDLVVTKASEKKIELAYLIRDELPAFLIGDVTRLRQILVNLLTNSVKFTETGEVVISVSGQLRDQHQYQLHFAVRDTGLGIPPNRVDRLFQSFSQVDASTTRRFGGTGLGLAISKQLSELMGGTMWVESAGIPGQGSTFHFTILAQEAPDQTQDSIQNHMPADLIGLRILIVDDNPTNCEILQHYTQSWKMLPTIVGSGKEALKLLNKQLPFDLAILDFQMPEMDGVTLAKEIHSQLQNKAFPLILLSSLGYHEAQSDDPVFSAILTKPIKPSQLFDSLGVSINSKWIPVKQKFNPSTEKEDRDLGQRHPLRILVVDDNTVNQTVALSFLSKVGYRADVASNGFEALDALQRQFYDLVFMDGQMPEMDGEEATRQIRQLLAPDQQPHIVAMTANAMQGDRERYLACGMDDYISKPIRMRELVRVLHFTQPLQHHPLSAIETNNEPGDQDMHALPPQSNGLTSFDETIPAASAEPQALNPQALQEFRDMMGDDGQEMVANLINLYIVDSQELIEKMRKALLPSDCEVLRREAHTLKGNSSQIGAETLANRCFELEKLAKAGSTVGSEDLIDQIQADYDRAKVDLEKLITTPVA